MASTNYKKCVFINCPFDQDYSKFQRAIIFTVLSCNLTPKIASECGDSGKVRIEKIINILSGSKYSIHDLSRIEPLKGNELPRFNMPFELGIDIGHKTFIDGEKKLLVFEKEQYRYQRFISDFAGNDIRCHKYDIETVVRETRNWLRQNVCEYAPPGTLIWTNYNLFSSDTDKLLKHNGYEKQDIENMPINEHISLMRSWLSTKLKKIELGNKITNTTPL